VAYVRYVSVYRQFDNVGEFIAEIQALERRAIKNPLQRHLFDEEAKLKKKS
jgi:transcriptional repressor NrdR